MSSRAVSSLFAGVLALGALWGCSGASPSPLGGSSSGGTSKPGGGEQQSGGSSCTCSIDINGEHKDVACGQSACVAGQQVSCGSDASISNGGACGGSSSNGGSGSNSGGGSNGGGATGGGATGGGGSNGGGSTGGGSTGGGATGGGATGGGATGGGSTGGGSTGGGSTGGGSTGGTSATPGVDATIDGNSVHFSSAISSIATGTIYIFAKEASDPNVSELSLQLPSLNAGTYSCALDAAHPERQVAVFLTRADSSELQSNTDCSVSITTGCVASTVVQGTLSKSTLTSSDNNSTTTVSATFTASCP